MHRLDPTQLLETFASTTTLSDQSSSVLPLEYTPPVASIFMATPIAGTLHARATLTKLLRDAAAVTTERSEHSLSTALTGFIDDLPAHAYAHTSPGVAIFISTTATVVVRTASPPPTPFITVARSPHILPLIRDLAQFPDHHVLTVSAAEAALFEVALTNGTIEAVPVPLPDRVPSSAAQVNAFLDLEPVLNYHSVGGTSPTFHGQGGAPKIKRTLAHRFASTVARSLKGLPEVSTPIVLMAPPTIGSLVTVDAGIEFAAVSTLNPSKLSPCKVAESSFAALEGYIPPDIAAIHKAAERLFASRVLVDPPTIATATAASRVDALLVRPDQVFLPDHTDLVTEVSRFGGRVVIDPDLAQTPLLALLRW